MMDKDRLLPVLRNIRDDDFLLPVGIMRGVAPGLGVFLAEVGPTLTTPSVLVIFSDLNCPTESILMGSLNPLSRTSVQVYA
jgi:hypothetical protein